MAEDKTTIVDAQAQIEGKLSGKDASVHGRVRGEIALSGRLLIGEEGSVARERGGRRRRDRRTARGRRARPLGDAARDRTRQGPDRRAVARRARRRLALRPRRLRRGAHARRDGREAATAGPAAPAAAPEKRPAREAARAGRAPRLRAARRRRAGDPRRRRARPGRPGRAQLPRQPALREKLKATRAAAVVLAPGHEPPLPSLVSDNPYLPSRAPWRCCGRGSGRRRASTLRACGRERGARRRRSRGALAVVGAGVRIGARSVIHPQRRALPECPRSATTACCTRA